MYTVSVDDFYGVEPVKCASVEDVAIALSELKDYAPDVTKNGVAAEFASVDYHFVDINNWQIDEQECFEND